MFFHRNNEIISVIDLLTLNKIHAWQIQINNIFGLIHFAKSQQNDVHE